MSNYFVCYRLYFGMKDKNGGAVKKQAYRKAIARISTLFDGFTIYSAKGYWKGVKEPSKIVEILALNIADKIVKGLAADLRDILDQECVLVTSTPTDSEMV